jgi:hypothetical protein
VQRRKIFAKVSIGVFEYLRFFEEGIASSFKEIKRVDGMHIRLPCQPLINGVIVV